MPKNNVRYPGPIDGRPLMSIQLPDGWVLLDENTAQYRAKPYYPRVCGKRQKDPAYAYTVTVEMGDTLDITIESDEGGDAHGGAYLSHEIPLEVIHAFTISK